VTTVRLDAAVQEGLRVLETHGDGRPLNKWVNMALADLIDRRAATIESQLDQALESIRAYRKADPGHKRALRAFIDAEVTQDESDVHGGPYSARFAVSAAVIVDRLLGAGASLGELLVRQIHALAAFFAEQAA
jgi:hypothetical protein